MMNQRIIGMALVAIAVCVWQTPSAFAGQQQQAITDQPFVQKAVLGGLAEVQLGKRAVDHAASPDVQPCGQRRIEDHARANQELMAVLSQQGLSVPTALDATHQQAAKRCAKLQGAAFDRAYIQHMVKDHAQDVKLFSTEATPGKDPELRRFAAQTLPTLEAHLNMGRTLAKKPS
jgi:putative membrane protein